MKKMYFSCYAFLLFVLAVVQKRNGKKLKVKEVVKTDPVIDWSATADSCTYVLIEQFMNKEKELSGNHRKM